ncbi:MAG: deoxyribose-phosphate aldolase [Nitrospirae bacterium]|nr:deoxyribose-phosphate aldolase [Nitrospirota bacterium]
MHSDWPADLIARIDHTLLRPDATKTEVRRLCEEARQYGFGVVFVPPCYLEEALAVLGGTSIRVGVPIGFPLGSQTTRTKVSEAVEACEKGAAELDMVINIGRLKSGDYDAVETDIAAVVQATPGVGHKAIIECCFLAQQEKTVACRLAVEAGVDYVKTSTGFGPGGATAEDVRLIRASVAGRAKVKASGGIRDLKAALALLEAGADRIGTSAGVQIVEEWIANQPRGRCRMHVPPSTV